MAWPIDMTHVASSDLDMNLDFDQNIKVQQNNNTDKTNMMNGIVVILEWLHWPSFIADIWDSIQSGILFGWIATITRLAFINESL